MRDRGENGRRQGGGRYTEKSVILDHWDSAMQRVKEGGTRGERSGVERGERGTKSHEC